MAKPKPGSGHPKKTAAPTGAAAIAQQLARAMALHQQGQLQTAAQLYLDILRQQPRHVDALNLLGVIALGRQDYAAAIDSIGQAVRAMPRSAELHFNLGNALWGAGDAQAAVESYDRAIGLSPHYPQAYCNRGACLQSLQQFDAALASLNQAIAQQADLADAYCNRGIVQRCQLQFEAALSSYNQALALQPGDAKTHSNRGNVLKDLGQLDAALAAYDEAIRLDPQYVTAHTNRGIVLHEQQQLMAALESYDRAIRIDPQQPDAYFNMAVTCLLRGDFENGWPLMEWRWKSKLKRAPYTMPLWLGEEPIAGKTILLHSEQGLGDTLQFCRYAKLVQALGARVVLLVQHELLEVLHSLEGVDQLLTAADPVPPCDFQCPLMSLPLALRSTLDNIPAPVQYISAQPDKVRAWQRVLGERTKPRVGLVWSGGSRPDQPVTWAVNQRRNVPLQDLVPLNLPGLDFYSLQKGEPAQSDLARALAQNWSGPVLKDYTGELRDFSDTAALIENLDLVLSVDTSTAHLAAAMGKPVWLLNRFDTCWRWLIDRDDSPWYPSLRLFRQTQPGQWADVVAQVRTHLLAQFGLSNG